MNYNDDGSRFPTSVWDFTGVVNNSKQKLPHPTQKPLSLFMELIRTFTNENDIVFDGYAGSGTTAEACMKTNRNFIVCETSEKYYQISKKRITNSVDLFTLPS